MIIEAVTRFSSYNSWIFELKISTTIMNTSDKYFPCCVSVFPQ